MVLMTGTLSARGVELLLLLLLLLLLVRRRMRMVR